MALYGDDTSRYQGTIIGRNFEIIKATGGDDGLYVDPTCDTKYQANKKAGKLLGVYHITAMKFDPAKEADYFVNNCLGYIGEAILVLDFETQHNVAWAKAFFDRVYARTKVRGVLYASASAITAADWSPVAVHDALYEAGYPPRFNVLNPPLPLANGSDMPFSSGAWDYATIWQYSSSAGTLDKDIAYITPDGWHKLAQGDRGKTTTPAPKPAPAPTPVPPKETPSEPTKTPPVAPAQPSQPKAGDTTPSTADQQEPETVPPPKETPVPAAPTGEPAKVIVPAPHTYFSLWELIVAIFKKLLGLK